MQVLDQNLVIKNWNINAGDYFTSLQLFFPFELEHGDHYLVLNRGQ